MDELYISSFRCVKWRTELDTLRSILIVEAHCDFAHCDPYKVSANHSRAIKVLRIIDQPDQ